MRTIPRLLVVLSLSVPLVATAAPAGSAGSPWSFREFTVSEDALCEVTEQWRAEVLASHPKGTWAPIRFQPTDAQLARMGLPSTEVLLSRRYPRPTLVTEDGRFFDVPLPALRAAMDHRPGHGGGGGGGGGGGSQGGPTGPRMPEPAAWGSGRARGCCCCRVGASGGARWPTCTGRPGTTTSARRATAARPARPPR